MTFWLIAGIVVFMAIVLLQVGKTNELAAAIKGEKNTELESNNVQGNMLMIFMVVFMLGTVWSFFYYRPYFLGFAGNNAASIHGASIDFMFKLTLVITGIVFFITQILLFYFSWKYRDRGYTKASFWAHDNRLEMIWMGIPAVAMAILIIFGMNIWNKATADIPANAVPGKDFIEIEATAYQFGWSMRYPGKDNVLGNKNFRLISGDNALGLDWTDTRNHDDIISDGGDTIKLPVNKKIRVRITAKDVLHNFYLPQFRVKMDAVPGTPTYFVFTPTMTTDDMRTKLSKKAMWKEVVEDAATGEKVQRWQTFVYELACAELCGKGHFSMRRVVDVVPQAEFDAWMAKQKPFYKPAGEAPHDASTTSGTEQSTTAVPADTAKVNVPANKKVEKITETKKEVKVETKKVEASKPPVNDKKHK